MKKYNPKYKTTYPAERRTDAEWEETALTYARWLAAKRGIEVPQAGLRGPRSYGYSMPTGVTYACVQWADVYEGRTRKRTRKWSGEVVYVQIATRRIRAVQWGYERGVYNTRKNGKQGAWLYNEFVPELEIELPHWDWVPKVIDLTDVLELDPAWEVLPLAA